MTLTYLDTSALAKLVVSEAESAALRSWLHAASDATPVTSALTRVELTRAAARRSEAARLAVPALLAAVHLIAVTGEVLATAATLEPPVLRSLDAIHLATAQLVGPSLTAFIAYDERLAEAARAAGLPVVVPT